ncbi:hypothetical protein PACILC2_22530 [Paenibacillus cisolokensis]|uniref:Uncharacterized protein n=1 Tax=Paenibacillus cisolokensis TaxID=1658519 RepID=A0ABQ4N682_9BACL|nr:hypothetical protein [Paenibacillus cisolokensis]GIQ63685.1 hypothetical protein PACILC2_22530 [Paenibacillus cisolokensis]
MTVTKRFNIEEIPLVTLYVATDQYCRLRLSTDLIRLYSLDAGNRVALGYDSAARAIAVKLAANPNDPTAANVDKRGYISARRFFARTQIEPERRRYVFEAEQDGWLVFIAEDSAS